MKLFITGLAGMLGSNIAYILKSRHHIVGVDILPTNIKDIVSYTFDMRDKELLEKCIGEESPDVIIHTAAAVNVDRCEENPEYARSLNEELTIEICEIANKKGIKVVYISTDALFDGEEKTLYKEIDKTRPINVYGETKLAGESTILKYERNLVIRTNIYGFNIQHKNSFGEWIYKSLQDGQTLNMFSDIDFSPILVNELTEVIMKLLEENKSGLYHVCGTGAITKYEFGCILKEKFGIKTGKIVESNSAEHHFIAPRSKHMGMDNSKVKKELGIEISTSRASIEKFYELYQEQYDQKL